MSGGYVTVANEAIAIARRNPEYAGVIMMLYADADLSAWDSFDCSERWLANRLNVTPWIVRKVLALLEAHKLMEVVHPGDRVNPRMVRILMPKAADDRQPGPSRTSPPHDAHTAARTSDAVQEPIEEGPPRTQLKHVGGDQASQMSTPSPSPPPNPPCSPPDDPVGRVWARAVELHPDLGPKPTKTERETINARVSEAGVDAVVAVVEWVFLGPDSWWRDTNPAPAAFLRPKHFPTLAPKARTWKRRTAPSPAPPRRWDEAAIADEAARRHRATNPPKDEAPNAYLAAIERHVEAIKADLAAGRLPATPGGGSVGGPDQARVGEAPSPSGPPG